MTTFPQKPIPPLRILKTSIEEEISENEFQKKIVKVNNKLKEETQKLICYLKEDVNKQLN
jgi:hypothetical protein